MTLSNFINSGIGLSISGLVYVFIVLTIYLGKKQYSDLSSNIFRFILESSIVFGFYEIFFFVFDHLLHDEYPLIDMFLFRVYGISIIIILIAIYLYIKTRLIPKENNTAKKLLTDKWTIVYLVISLSLFIYSFTKPSIVYYSFDSYKEITNSCFLSYYIIYFYTTIAFLKITLYDLRKEKDTRNILLFYLLILLLLIVLMSIFNDIYSVALIFELSSCYFYLLKENQDKTLANELSSTMEEATLADKEKTVFLSKMSHEIRTPLNSIIGFSNRILEKGEQSTGEEIAQDMKDIYVSGKNLMEVINNVLLYSSLESGDKKIEEREYRLNDIFGELNSYSNAMLEEGVNFVVDVEKDTPNVYYGDKLKLYRVLVNLVGNGIKYTKKGNVTVKVTTSKVSSGFLKLIFKIIDNGEGIKEHTLDYLFSNENNENYVAINGVGLGLTLAKKISDLIDGKLTYESNQNGGTTFTFEIVQRVVDYNEKVGNVSFENYKSLDDFSYFDCSKYRVLVADDNKVNMKVIERQLHYYKINYDFVNNGLEAINKIKEGIKYDLIILDHMMPEMDGLQTFRNLKKRLKDDMPPVVIMTANIVTEVKDSYIKEGFSYFLSKPIDLRELNVIMKKVFNKEDKR